MTTSDSKDAAFPKRFYETVSVRPEGQGYRIFLDERPVSTPLKQPLVLPSVNLAEAIAGEWDAQEDRVVPSRMPISKLAHTCIDHAVAKRSAIVDEFVSYGSADMLCYRAEAPDGLVERQKAHWDPLLAWAASELGAQMVVAEGIVHREQPSSALNALRSRAETYDIFKVTGLQALTALTGSAVLALALVESALTGEAGWQASIVDEEWQAEKWGRDMEAERQRSIRRQEYDAALEFVRLLAS